MGASSNKKGHSIDKSSHHPQSDKKASSHNVEGTMSNKTLSEIHVNLDTEFQ